MSNGRPERVELGALLHGGFRTLAVERFAVDLAVANNTLNNVSILINNTR